MMAKPLIRFQQISNSKLLSSWQTEIANEELQ
jgi:hypothetical protein